MPARRGRAQPAPGQIDLFQTTGGGATGGGATGDGLVRVLSLPDTEAHEATLAHDGDAGLHVARDGSTGIHHAIVRDGGIEHRRAVGGGDRRYVEPNLAPGPTGQAVVGFRRSDPGGLPAIMLAR